MTWWPIKALNARGLSGVLLTLIAYGAAALLLMPSAWRQRHHWRHRLPLMGFIVVSGGLWSLLFVLALEGGNASRVVLLYYLSTVWMIVGGCLLLRERVDTCRVFCLVLGLSGAGLVLGLEAVMAGAITMSDVLALSAGFAQATTCLAFRAAGDVPVASKNAFMVIGSVAAAAMAMPMLPGIATTDVAADVVLLALLFGAVWLLLAETLVQYGISHLPASRAAVLLLAELPITFVSAAVIAGERVSAHEVGGAILIGVAAWIDNRRSEPAH
jgi:drug/metabolite transporter (DMT)-like permease